MEYRGEVRAKGEEWTLIRNADVGGSSRSKLGKRSSVEFFCRCGKVRGDVGRVVRCNASHGWTPRAVIRHVHDEVEDRAPGKFGDVGWVPRPMEVN